MNAAPEIAFSSEQGKANATAMSVASLARRFGLPLEGWYPPQAAPARRRPISWQELCRTIGGAYDIASESRSLKERGRKSAAQAVKEAAESAGPQNMQLSMFQLDDPVLVQIRDQIKGLDINSLTPIEALNKLNDIKKITGI